jgi:hypothetical protein
MIRSRRERTSTPVTLGPPDRFRSPPADSQLRSFSPVGDASIRRCPGNREDFWIRGWIRQALPGGSPLKGCRGQPAPRVRRYP